jgi:opacity protein-like surface antigen
LTQFNLTPNGTINYSFVVGETIFTLFNRINGNAGNRPEIAGNGLSSGVDFNRLNNQVGLSVTHAFTEDTSASGMYGFTIDRGLNDQFGILDQDQHTVSAGVYHRLSPYWTAGLSGQAVKTTFSQQFQNGSITYGAGPMLSFQPSEFIILSGSVQYTISEFSSDGQISDTTDFSGLTYQISASHRITSNVSHTITVSSGVNSGLGSNFTETFMAGYRASWQFHERMGLNLGFTYSKITQSQSQQALVPITFPTGTFLVPVSFIANDEATFYDINLGTGYQLTDRANLALNYIHSIRDSRFATRSFSVNTVTLSVNYRF